MSGTSTQTQDTPTIQTTPQSIRTSHTQEHPNNANQVVKVYNANRHKHKSINKYNGTARSYDDADARKHGIGSSKERPKLVHDRGMDSNWNKRTGWHGYKYPALDKVVHEPVK